MEQITDLFIRRNADQFDKAGWIFISRNITLFNLSLETFSDYIDEFDWSSISECQNLSEAFIREHQDKVDWIKISKNQRLSEDFIREFKDKVYMNYIFVYQMLPLSFLKEMQSKLYWMDLTLNPHTLDIIIDKFHHIIDWDYVFKNRNQNVVDVVKFTLEVKGIKY